MTKNHSDKFDVKGGEVFFTNQIDEGDQDRFINNFYNKLDGFNILTNHSIEIHSEQTHLPLQEEQTSTSSLLLDQSKKKRIVQIRRRVFTNNASFQNQIIRRRKYESKNLLATVRSIYFKFLKKQLGEKFVKEDPHLQYFVKKPWMGKKDFNTLHASAYRAHLSKLWESVDDFYSFFQAETRCNDNTMKIFKRKLLIIHQAFINQQPIGKLHAVVSIND